MALLEGMYAKLHLKVNEAKSAVASVFGRKFLGFSVWVAKGAEVKLRVSAKAMTTFKQRIRQLTRRSGGRSMGQVVEALRPYMLGWKAYFAVAQTPECLAQVRRMDTAQAASHPTQTLAVRHGCLSRVACSGGQR